MMPPGRAVTRIALQVPCVYTILARPPGDRRQRHYHAIERIEVSLPRIDRLPRPHYTAGHIDDREPPWLSWYEIRGNLLRRVAEDGVPVTLGQIERGFYLVQPPWSMEEWSDDHPSALYRVPLRRPHRIHYEPLADLDGYAVLDSDRDRRITETRRVWERCVEHLGTVLAPARPPTWCLRVGRGFSYLGVSATRVPPLPLVLPEIHFAIGQEQAARDFARLVTDDGELQDHKMLCGYPSDPGDAAGGALETARAFGYHLCKRMAGRRPHAMTRAELEVFVSMRTLFERSGTDAEGDAALLSAENLDMAGTGPDLIAWQGLLKDRRRFLWAEPDATVLRDFRIR